MKAGANGYPKRVLFGGRYLPIIYADGREPLLKEFSAGRKKSDAHRYWFWTLCSWDSAGRKQVLAKRLFRCRYGESPRRRLLGLADDLALLKLEDAQQLARDISLAACLTPSSEAEISAWLREHPADKAVNA